MNKQFFAAVVFVVSTCAAIACGMEWRDSRELASTWMALTAFFYFVSVIAGISAYRGDHRRYREVAEGEDQQ